MAVTDSERLNDAQFKSRNSERSKPWRKSWSTRSIAEVDGGMCGKCGRVLAAGEPVYLDYRYRGWREPSHKCRDCAPKYLEGVQPGVQRGRDYLRDRVFCNVPCDTCERPVVFRATVIRLDRRRHVFCSRRCSNQHYNGMRNERNAKVREKVCEVCGEEFTATRRDAKTCSPACKQKAYRRRKADPAELVEG